MKNTHTNARAGQQIASLGCFCLSELATRRAGCSWQGRRRQQLRESALAEPLLNPLPLTPSAGSHPGPSQSLPFDNAKRKKAPPKGKKNETEKPHKAANMKVS